MTSDEKSKPGTPAAKVGTGDRDHRPVFDAAAVVAAVLAARRAGR